MLAHALITSLINDILNFLIFWFINGSRRLWNNFSNQIQSLEQTFGIRANFKRFFAPLYGDYSLPGYVFAIPWRLLLMTVGIILVLFITIFYTILFVVYITLPLLISILFIYGPTLR
jgi:hypothetical protein